MSFTTFVLFFRFHVYAALFSAALLGFAAAAALRSRRRGWTVAAAAVLALGLGGEALNASGSDWRPAPAPYESLEELAGWLSENAGGRPVLAHFGTSAYALAYAGTPVLLHPKFEDRAIRARVEEFGTELFKGTERSFRDWADRHGAEYYVHALGEFAGQSPEYQMRYMVDALRPPPEAPAWAFEYQPYRLTRFRYAWGNGKFRVFRIVRRADETVADGLASRAAEALAQGRVSDAELLAERALRLFAGQADALGTYRRARALREAGFREPAPEAP